MLEFYVTLFAAVGSGLIGGLLFAFSNFVMKALGRQPTESGVQSMQAINVDIVNPLFLLAFFGTALAALLSAILALRQIAMLGAVFQLVGSVIYLVGVLGATMLGNVPMNNRLARTNARAQDVTDLWQRYQRDWVRWNHVRSAAALISCVLFVLALRQSRASTQEASRGGEIWEVTYLKAKSGGVDALANYIRQNWFVMDAKARAAGHMEGFRLLRGTPADTSWDLMEISVYRDSTQHARIDSIFRVVYRPAHVPVLVEGKGLKELGAIVGSLTTRWVGGDK